ncbi:MAG: DUF4349 domain-containing protein [Clostridia bacterium]|nr:DUF4349 domain-containing protein [Clostridia bacterium]
MKAEKEMSCSLFIENIDDYIDAELDAETSNAMREHADGCESCRAVLNETTHMLKELAGLDSETAIPLDCQAAWRRAVRKEAVHVSRRRTLKHISRAAGAVAAAAVVIAGINVFGRGVQIAPTAVMSDSAPAVEYSYDDYEYEGRDLGYRALAPTANMFTAGTIIQSDGEYEETLSVESDMDISQEAATGGQSSVIIRNATRRLETSNFDQCARSINDLVEEYEGYFEQSSVEGQEIAQDASSGRVARMTARIPSVDLDAFLLGVDAVGDVVFSRITAEDISESYYDTQSRLTSYRNQLNRLNELVSTAADLEQLLMLEEKIADVQYSIDSLEGTINSWNSQVSYSTVGITVTEVAPRNRVVSSTQPLQERMTTAFYASVNWLNDLWQTCVVGLAAIAPALAVLIPLAAIVIVIVSIARRKRRRQ